MRTSAAAVVAGLLLSVVPTTAHARADSHGAAVGHRAPVPVLVTAGPVSVPIGTPIALLFVAAALIFLPTVPGAAG